MSASGARLLCSRLLENAVEWQLDSKASEPANIVRSRSSTGLSIADSEIVSMPTAICAGKQPFFLCGTNGCQNCQIARGNRRCARQWSHTYNLANVEVASRKDRRRDVLVATRLCLPSLQLPTLRGTLREPRKAGVGKETGADRTALLSKKKELLTTFDRRIENEMTMRFVRRACC